MENLYGVAFSVEGAEENCNFAGFPEVVVASAEEQAVDFAKRISAYCKWVVPFRNSERREKVDWHYVKENEVGCNAGRVDSQ